MWPFNKNPQLIDAPPISYPRDVEFDIEGEGIFSVERLYRNEEKNEHTVIGYYDKASNESKEWHLDCSIAKHNQFVARFRKKLGLLPDGNTPLN